MIWMKTVVLSVWFLSVTCNKLNTFNVMSARTLNLQTNLIGILELCFTNISNPLAITPNLVDMIYKNLPSTLMAPIVLLDDDFVSKEIQLYLPTYPTYILSVPGVAELSNLVQKIKSSAMWSIHSKFLVIGNPEEYCNDALPILKELWKFELLSSVVVCPEPGNSSLYTYNPYTNRAPDPWLKVEGSNRPDERWTLYKTAFNNDSQLCDVLTFDKTEFLDGYPLRIVSQCLFLNYLEFEILPTLNMTANIDCVARTNTSNVLVKGKHDMIAEPDLGSRHFDIENIIPSIFSELDCVIVTQKRSFSSPFADFSIPFDFNTGIAMILIIVLIIVLIVLNNEYEIVAAFRDVLLLLLRMGIETPLDRIPFKITFLVGFFFVFYFSPVIEAGIFAVLTRPSSYNIETLKDLRQNNYQLYYPRGFHNIILRANLWTSPQDMRYLHPQFIFTPDTCLELARKDNTVACIYISEMVLNKALDKNFHISSKTLFKNNYFHFSRKDWPLNKKIEVKTQRLFETGFIEKFQRTLVLNPKKMMKFFKKIYEIESSTEIDFEDLTYMYAFIAFSQILAILAFGVEHLIAYFRRR